MENKKNWKINFTTRENKIFEELLVIDYYIDSKFEFIMEQKWLEYGILFIGSSSYRYLYFVDWLPLVFP